MRILAFLGLGATVILFGTTWIFSINEFDIRACTCTLLMPSKDIYSLISLGLAVFFLLFSTLLLTKITELSAYSKQQAIDQKELQETALIDTSHYNIYQLPLVQLFSKISIIGCVGIFLLVIMLTNLPYELVGTCDHSQCDIHLYDSDFYVFWYGISGLYFSFLSYRVYKNISTHKKQASNF